MRAAPLLLLLLFGCDQPQTEQARRTRAATAVRRVDSTMPRDVIIRFTAPPTWDSVKLSRGVVYRQPTGFTLGLNDTNVPDCDTTTPTADLPVFQRSLADRWPLTLAMRRGDLARLAYVNGFTLDSTRIAVHDQASGDSTRVRRGEGWMLLSGRAQSRGAPIEALFGAVRYPGGCYLVLAARGVDINIDTLGYVLSTVRFGAPAAAQPQ